MAKINWRDYLVADPLIHHGDLCFRGTRIPVSIILGSLADGMTAEEIRAAYPQLEPVQIRAALAYGGISSSKQGGNAIC